MCRNALARCQHMRHSSAMAGALVHRTWCSSAAGGVASVGTRLSGVGADGEELWMGGGGGRGGEVEEAGDGSGAGTGAVNSRRWGVGMGGREDAEAGEVGGGPAAAPAARMAAVPAGARARSVHAAAAHASAIISAWRAFMAVGGPQARKRVPVGGGALSAERLLRLC